MGSRRSGKRGHIRTTYPDEDTAILIHRQALALDKFGLQIFQIRVIELELPLEGAIGQAPPALEHGDRLVENVLKGHRPPSLSLDEACRSRCGNGKSRPDAYIPHTVEKRKQEVGGVLWGKDGSRPSSTPSGRFLWLPVAEHERARMSQQGVAA